MTARSNTRAASIRRDVWLRFAVALALLAAFLFLAPRARADASLAGVHPALAAKARQLVRACGATVLSGVRHTRVAGSRRLSLHASGRAVDLRGPPRCLYARLLGWPGGVTTDYRRVAHVHVSLGGREQGLRFAHRHAAPVRRVRLARL